MSPHVPNARLLGALLLCLASPLAQAQAYRCGNTYSQQPCEGGQAVQVDDARSDEQRAQSQAATRMQERLGRQMETSRLRAEREEWLERRNVKAKARAADADESGPVTTTRTSVNKRKRRTANVPPESADGHPMPRYVSTTDPSAAASAGKSGRKSGRKAAADRADTTAEPAVR